MFVPVDLKTASGALDGRIFVSGVGRLQFSGRELKDTEPHRDEKFRLVALADAVIDAFQNRGGRGVFQKGEIVDQDLGGHHKESSRNAFAGDISHDEAEMVVVDQEEVIEVSADLLRRIHGCEDLKFLTVRESGEDTGNHSLLDLACHIEFCMNTLLLDRDVGKILHIILHISFHIGQKETEIFNLVTCGYVETGEMTGAKFFISAIVNIMRGGLCNPVDRLDNCPPHLTPHKESEQDGYEENCGQVLEREAFYSFSDVGK